MQNNVLAVVQTEKNEINILQKEWEKAFFFFLRENLFEFF